MSDTENHPEQPAPDAAEEVRRRKWPWILLLAMLIIGLAGTAVFIATTETGLKWTITLIARNIPGKLEVERVEGRLIDSIGLRGLHYKAGRITLTIDDLKLRIQPAALLYEQLHIEELTVTGLNYTQMKSPEPLTRLPDIRLPVSIALDKATISKATVNLPDMKFSQPIDKITLTASFKRQRLHIDSLTVESSLVHAKAQGTVKPQGDYPLEARISWATEAGKYAAFSAETTLKGKLLDEFDFTQNITAPFQAGLQGTINDLLTETRWRASLDIRELNPRDIETHWPQLHIAGKVRADGDRKHAHAQTALRLKKDGYAVDTDLRARYAEQKIQIQELALTLRQVSGKNLPGRPPRVTAQGEVRGDLTKDPQLKMTGAWSALAWPLPGDAIIASEQGKFKLSGKLDDYTLAFDAAVAGKNIPAGQWSMEGQGDRAHLTLDKVHADLLDGQITGQGAVTWKPQLAWNFDLEGNQLDPGRQWPQWPGRLALQTTLGGKRRDGQSLITVNVQNLSGRLREIPFDSATAQLSIGKGGIYELPRFEIISGATRLTASGRLSDQWDLRWKLESQDIKATLATQNIKAGGRLNGSGRIEGPLRTPRIIASMSGNDLHIDEHRASDVTINVDVDLQDKLPSRLHLRAKGLLIGKETIESIIVDGNGLATRHTLNATLKAKQEALNLRAEGGFEHLGDTNITWNGQLTQSDIQSRAFGPWTLAVPGPLTVAQEHAQLGPWCWNQSAAKICVDANQQAAAGWQSHAQANNLPLLWFKPLLPATATLAGTFDATLSARRAPDGLLTGEGKFSPAPGTVIYPLAPDQQLVLAYTDGTLEAMLGPDTLSTQIKLTLIDRGYLDGALALPRPALPAILKNPASTATQLSGRLNAEVYQLDLLPELFPGVENTQGKVNVALAVNGTPDKPIFSGDAKLEQGTALVPRLGLRLRDINMHVTGNENSLALDGQVRSGDGMLRLNGKAQPQAQQGWNAELALKGENFEAIRTGEIKATASPDLIVTIVKNKIDISGDLLIPQATLEPRDLSAAVRPSEDVIIEDRKEEEERASRWTVSTLIGLKLGDSVRFKGFGLSGRFTGDVALVDLPGQLTTALGEIRIEEGGEYRAANQTLTVRKGSKLIFTGGPINNPGVDARAVRQIRQSGPLSLPGQIGQFSPTGQITVGFNVRGTLQKPVLSVFSDPAMPEQDALSYLLLGRPMGQASTAEGQQLFAAATGLGFAGGEVLAQKIGKTFGIQDVRIEPATATQKAALVLGTYLSPKLYVSYGVGVIDRASTFRLRYQLSRRWTVEGESGLYGGADILYNLERK